MPGFKKTAPRAKRPSALPSRYLWTKHAEHKMQFYGLSPSRLQRVLRNPARTEVGVVPDTVGVMQPATPRHTSEIWLLYRPLPDGRLHIITAWRYPGKSPVRDAIPIPDDIRRELGW